MNDTSSSLYECLRVKVHNLICTTPVQSNCIWRPEVTSAPKNAAQGCTTAGKRFGNHIETVCFYFVLEGHNRSYESYPHEGNRPSQEGLLSCDGLVRHVTAVT